MYVLLLSVIILVSSVVKVYVHPVAVLGCCRTIQEAAVYAAQTYMYDARGSMRIKETHFHII
jgi:hypothetical protein